MDTAPDETPRLPQAHRQPQPAPAAPAAPGVRAPRHREPAHPRRHRPGTSASSGSTARGRGRMLAGVAAGLADYFDVDPTMVRIGFVALAFLGGLAVPLYLAGWLLIPDEDSDVSVAEELLARERARGAY